MRNGLIIALVLVTAPLSAYASPVVLEGGARAQALTLASEALNKARAVRGRFLQTSPDGSSSQGAFYISRPGKVRFEYAAPRTMTIVSNGALLSVADRALKTDDRYPLRMTPLYFALKRDIDLQTDGKVTRVARDGDAVLLTVRDRKGQSDGSITLSFDQPSRELRQWRVVDGQGQVTQITLTQVQNVSQLDPKLFELAPQKRPPGPGR